ncbi:MAG: hypothetical protein ACRD13_06055, partial [Terriglobales bacterium]
CCLLASGQGWAQAAPAPPSTQASQATQARILVLPFNNQSGDINLDWIGESFVQAFSDTFRGAGLPVLGPSATDAAFNQEGVPHRSTLSQATLIQVAGQAHAGWLILGSFATSGGQFQATASVINLSRQHLTRVSAGPAPLAKLQTVQGQLAWRVLSILLPGTTITQAQVLTRRQQVPLAAYERFIRALLATEPAVEHKFLADAVHLDPEYSQAIFRLGLWYWRNDDYRTALLWLPQVDAQDPDYPRAQFLAGQSAYRLGQDRRATELYSRLATLWPRPQVLNNWALAAARLRQRDALTLLSRARRMAPAAPAAADTAGASPASDPDLAALLTTNAAAVACQLGDSAQALAIAQAANPAAGSPLAAFVAQLSAPGAVCPNRAARDLAQPAQHFPIERFRQQEAARERADRAQAAALPAPRRLQFYLAAAVQFEDAGDLGAAQRQLLAALRLAPRSAAAHIGLVHLDLLRWDAPAARAQVAVLRAITPHNGSIPGLQRQIQALAARQSANWEAHASGHR